MCHAGVAIAAKQDTQLMSPMRYTHIPGTRINGLPDMEAVEQELECFSRGQWVFNATPRWLPWDKNPGDHPQQPNYHSCDEAHAQ